HSKYSRSGFLSRLVLSVRFGIFRGWIWSRSPVRSRTAHRLTPEFSRSRGEIGQSDQLLLVNLSAAPMHPKMRRVHQSVLHHLHCRGADQGPPVLRTNT